MGTWINFRELREQLDPAAVLAHYGVDVKRRGTQGTAFCPLPGHTKDAKSSRPFSVSFQKRAFQCFGCGRSGNLIDFVAYMEGLNPKDLQQFRQAALIAQERFVGSTALAPAKLSSAAPAPQSPSAQSPVVVNAPLDFELKNLDTQPAYLLSRGITEATIDHFGLGLCTKGTFAGRIAIPLHDAQGRLIGYAGRTVYDDAIDAEHPKYLFPVRRQRDGKTLEFAKSLVRYRAHAMSEKPLHCLVIVQGFPSCWHLWQHGFRDTVALMGATCSVDQANIIMDMTSHTSRIWCFTDAGKTGEKCAQSIFIHVGPQRFCKWVQSPRGQPTDCNGEELAELLSRQTEGQ